MQGVLEGFAVIGAVIALGFVLAHYEILGADSQDLLSRLVFFVATPALLFGLLARADVAEAFSANLAITAVSVAVTASLYVVVAGYAWRRSSADIAIGALSASYVNAGNLGLPIAAYVLGDASYVAPTLLFQLVVMTPIALAVLDTSVRGRRPSLGRLLAQPFANPVTLATLVGLVFAFTGWTVPRPIGDPIELVGGMAVPGALLAYGVSLRLGPLPISGGSTGEIVLVTALKLILQPAAAYLLGAFAFGLEGTALFAVTVTAALPTAHNIFVFANRYGRGTILARDSIFVTTLLSVPVLLVITALMT